MVRVRYIVPGMVSLALASGCKGNLDEGLRSAGETVVDGAHDVASSATSLVNVNLSNVLNDLALDLNIDKANIPVNAQVPITIAANVCGVSINILSVSTGGQANCTATSTSPELTQVVQQQLAAGGDVGGGAQTTSSGSTATGSGTTSDAEQQTQPPEQDPDPPQS